MSRRLAIIPSSVAHVFASHFLACANFSAAGDKRAAIVEIGGCGLFQTPSPIPEWQC
jgi:hypothetical protein